jgi:hypothetical protein
LNGLGVDAEVLVATCAKVFGESAGIGSAVRKSLAEQVRHVGLEVTGDLLQVPVDAAFPTPRRQEDAVQYALEEHIDALVVDFLRQSWQYFGGRDDFGESARPQLKKPSTR